MRRGEESVGHPYGLNMGRDVDADRTREGIHSHLRLAASPAMISAATVCTVLKDECELFLKERSNGPSNARPSAVCEGLIAGYLFNAPAEFAIGGLEGGRQLQHLALALTLHSALRARYDAKGLNN